VPTVNRENNEPIDCAAIQACCSMWAAGDVDDYSYRHYSLASI
jgi:hypothetical protein